MAVLSTLFDYGSDHGVFLNVITYLIVLSDQKPADSALQSILAALGSTAVYLGYKVYRRATRISIANVPGPKPDSFILGKDTVSPVAKAPFDLLCLSRQPV